GFLPRNNPLSDWVPGPTDPTKHSRPESGVRDLYARVHGAQRGRALFEGCLNGHDHRPEARSARPSVSQLNRANSHVALRESRSLIQMRLTFAADTCDGASTKNSRIGNE